MVGFTLPLHCVRCVWVCLCACLLCFACVCACFVLASACLLHLYLCFALFFGLPEQRWMMDYLCSVGFT
jgi:hypothetical protein